MYKGQTHDIRRQWVQPHGFVKPYQSLIFDDGAAKPRQGLSVQRVSREPVTIAGVFLTHAFD